ncbi:MAG: PAS domain-containing protein [Anaerolineae bacterium]|nr:PAS domain-containing protein [Anaerolineae bacterium]
MYLNTEHSSDTHTLWQDILHEIASNPDPRSVASKILDLSLTLTDSKGACFMGFDETRTRIFAGDADSLSQHIAHLEEIANNLEPGIYDSSNYDVIDWLSLPYLLAVLETYREKTGVLVLVFAEEQTPSHDDSTLKPLLDSLAILANQIKLNSSHKAAHQLAESLLESVSDPLFVLDEHHHVQLLNPAATKVFKMDEGEARGKNLQEVLQSEELVDLIHQKNKAQQEWTNEDNLTFVPRMEPIHANDGQIKGWTLALRDITRFKKLNHNQNEFTRIVSHDLRSPLTSMQGFANMLELGLVGELNEKQQHFVEKILNGISQMTALVDNIQDAGRYDPETGFYEISRTHCDLREMVQRITETQLVPAEKQELELTVHVADDVPIINADTNMLERAITNLIDNAIKYTPNGGSVSVKVYRENDVLRINVKDTGLGISPENQKHLFERHVRIQRQEHRKIKGSGLGLFIVKSVAQRHGGDAGVESTEGQGSTFYMTIPLSGSNLVNTQE